LPADPEVLCVGETMLLVTPEDGGALTAESRCVLRPAGAESNVAVHLARLGRRAAWASRLGADPLGALVLEGIAEAGVDVSSVERIPGSSTGVFFKAPGPQGTSVHYYRRDSAASTMDAAFLASLPLAGVRSLHLTGITPALSPGCRELTESLLVGRAAGAATISFDVNHRPALWDGDAADELLRYARLADVVFVGLDEAASLWGTDTASEIRTLIGDRNTLVVKDAAREAVSYSPAGETRVPARDVVVLEPVGAGDAFAAGWLAGMLTGLDDTARLRLGHLIAAGVLASADDHGVAASDGDLEAVTGVPAARWRAARSH
jgi:2-dehydro-3-deoxygluconokinase